MEQKKRLEEQEVLEMYEADLSPQVSRLQLNDIPPGESLTLEIIKINQVKTNFGERIDFIGKDKNENPLQFSSWNISHPGRLAIKIGTKLKLSSTGTKKFFVEVA